MFVFSPITVIIRLDKGINRGRIIVWNLRFTQVFIYKSFRHVSWAFDIVWNLKDLMKVDLFV